MAHPTLPLITALRQAAQNLRAGAHYAWGSHGACNCGHLLQVVTQLSKEEIIRHAQTVHGEWSEIAEDYCGVTNAPAYLLVSKLEELGLTPTDIHQLEYLENRAVLESLPGGFRWLKKNLREDVVLYFETFAEILEEQSMRLAQLPKPDKNLHRPHPKKGKPCRAEEQSSAEYQHREHVEHKAGSQRRTSMVCN